MHQFPSPSLLLSNAQLRGVLYSLQHTPVWSPLSITYHFTWIFILFLLSGSLPWGYERSFLRPSLPDTSPLLWLSILSHSPYTQGQILQRLVSTPCLHFLFPYSLLEHSNQASPTTTPNSQVDVLLLHPQSFIMFLDSLKHWPESSAHTVGANIFVELTMTSPFLPWESFFLWLPCIVNTVICLPQIPFLMFSTNRSLILFGETMCPVNQAQRNLYSQMFWK